MATLGDAPKARVIPSQLRGVTIASEFNKQTYGLVETDTPDSEARLCPNASLCLINFQAFLEQTSSNIPFVGSPFDPSSTTIVSPSPPKTSKLCRQRRVASGAS